MAKSNKQIEQEILAFLDTIGESSASFQEADTLQGLEKLIIEAASNFVLRVRENLQKANKIDTGELERSISQGDLINNNGIYEIEVGYLEGSKGAKYADYVNKGVKGVRSGEPSDSPYSFKNDKPGLSMILAIAKWYRRNAGFARRETQKTGLSAVQKKRKRLSKMANQADSLKSLAYATSVNIKRRGLKKTGFFDKAVQASFGSDFTRLVAVVAGRQIQVNITKYGNNNK